MVASSVFSSSRSDSCLALRFWAFLSSSSLFLTSTRFAFRRALSFFRALTFSSTAATRDLTCASILSRSIRFSLTAASFLFHSASSFTLYSVRSDSHSFPMSGQPLRSIASIVSRRCCLWSSVTSAPRTRMCLSFSSSTRRRRLSISTSSASIAFSKFSRLSLFPLTDSSRGFTSISLWSASLFLFSSRCSFFISKIVCCFLISWPLAISASSSDFLDLRSLSFSLISETLLAASSIIF